MSASQGAHLTRRKFQALACLDLFGCFIIHSAHVWQEIMEYFAARTPGSRVIETSDAAMFSTS